MHLESHDLPDGISRIKLDGQLDITGVGKVETHFYALCTGNPPRVIADLSGVGFASSLGIRMLLQAIKTVSARGGGLVLLNPTNMVHTALDISGLGKHIVHGGDHDAVAMLLQSGK
jgi:anti-anti-sigma factor